LGLVLASSAAGCGRIGFDPSAVGPGVDASVGTDGDSAASSGQLASITLWLDEATPLVNPLSPAFDPGISGYTVEVGLALQSVRVSAVPIEPTTTITIDGVTTTAGEQSAVRELALGATVITLIGTSSTGTQATYTVVLTRADQLAQQVYLKASNAETNEYFGHRVALSGDTLVVGAPLEDSNALGVGGDQADNSANASGAVYVFTRSAGVWVQEAYLKASNTDAGDQFGWTIGLSGNLLAIGANREDGGATGVGGDPMDNSVSDSGAVYVFTRSAGTWTQEAYIKPSNTGAFDEFGWSMALSGETLAVGARYEASSAVGVDGNGADNGAGDSGAVYVFARASGTWTQQAYLKASNTDSFDYFGWSVALAGDTLAVGAYGEASSGAGGQTDNSAQDSGAVYVFARSAGIWAQQDYLKALNVDAGDTFGWSVALSGETLAVGARYEDSSAVGVDGNGADNSAMNSGAVYVFSRSGGTWTQHAYLKASNTEAIDEFGWSIALSGSTLAVGAWGEDSGATGIDGNQADNSVLDSGAVYLFVERAGSWVQQAYVKASNPDPYDVFGDNLTLSGDTVVVGARSEDGGATGINGNQADNSAAFSGAVYVFQ
jgi:hypothetical protein